MGVLRVGMDVGLFGMAIELFGVEQLVGREPKGKVAIGGAVGIFEDELLAAGRKAGCEGVDEGEGGVAGDNQRLVASDGRHRQLLTRPTSQDVAIADRKAHRGAMPVEHRSIGDADLEPEQPVEDINATELDANTWS